MSYTPNPLVTSGPEAAVLATIVGYLTQAYTDGVKLTDRGLALNGHSVTITVDNFAKTATFTATGGDFSSVLAGDALEITGPPFNDLNTGYFKVRSVAGGGGSLVAERLVGTPFKCVAETQTVTANSQVMAFVAFSPLTGYNDPASVQYQEVIRAPFMGAVASLFHYLIGGVIPTVPLLVPSNQNGNFTASPGSHYRVDASGGMVTPTLVAGAGVAGQLVSFKKVDATTNKVRVTAHAGDLIDGNAYVDLTINGEAIILVATSTGWDVI